VALALIICACASPAAVRAFSPDPAIDSEVLGVVLDNILGGGQGGNVLLLDQEGPVASSIFMNQLRNDLGVRTAEVEDLIADMAARNQVSTLMSDLVSSTSTIQVVDLKSLSRRLGWAGMKDLYPGMQQAVRAYRPGYSSDGTEALVRCHLFPTAHGTSAAYLLRRHEGVWQIVWKDVSLYA
jgi:hypothetical protein